MTVTYTSEVACNKGFGSFLKLLFRWKGSVYKLIWKDMLLYSVFYYGLAFIYRYALDDEGKRNFEKLSLYVQNFTELIPMAFVLGFYVSVVIGRWWQQYITIPKPERLSVFISTFIAGQDDKGRMMRRTIVRYANLAFIMAFIMISPKVKKRFPTLDHLIVAGILTDNEKKILDATASQCNYAIYWVPLVWAGAIVARARKEGRIRDDYALKTIVDEINRLQGLCITLLNYDWISIPLVYTQVVTLAVYSFFLSTLFGRQFLDPSQKIEKREVDFYIPVFTYLQFFFYMGWLKVAETLVNPFGEDDDDFEINYMIDKSVKVSYFIVDEMHNEHPELVQDVYWDEKFPTELPYTVASEQFKADIPLGSTAGIEVPLSQQQIVVHVQESEEDKIEKFESIVQDPVEPRGQTPTYSVESLSLKTFRMNLSSAFSRTGERSSAIRRIIPFRTPDTDHDKATIMERSEHSESTTSGLSRKTDVVIISPDESPVMKRSSATSRLRK